MPVASLRHGCGPGASAGPQCRPLNDTSEIATATMVARGTVIVAQVQCAAPHDRRRSTKGLLWIDTVTIQRVDEPNPHSGEIEHH